MEARWLPRLAPNLPVAIPEPIAIGEPSEDFPYRWAVHRWIPGEGAALDRMDDPTTFALARSPMSFGYSKPYRRRMHLRPRTALDHSR